jgi:dihydroneopterin aldolase
MGKTVESYFKCNKRERAVFECGIKLGAMFHQFIGTPISSKNVDEIEKGIEAAVSIQPFVHDVSVKINRKCLRKGEYTLDYSPLDPKMLTAKVVIKYENILVTGRLRYIDELDYPLIYVEEIAQAK